jgi:3-dehydroquinate synthase
LTASTRVAVGGERPYDVLIGTDLTTDLQGQLGAPRRVLLVHPVALAAGASEVAAALREAGHRVTPAPVPDGEAAKDAATATDLWTALGRAGFTRSDVVVAFGGGATTDVAGFVAATWLRGVDVVHLPTTLLGMVDAAVGGKTGIDTEAGKNLVGAFHPPRAVLCDLAHLRSLPAAELAAGLAEVVKAGLVADPGILDLVETDPAAAADPGSPVLRELVERAVRFKAEVVSVDLRESGAREVLNYGHTLGHAIEKVEGYTWRHGDAVSVGMVYAAELSALAGRLDAAAVQRHRAVLGSLRLPTSYAGGRWPDLLSAMRVDKKARGQVLRFVVLDGIGRPGRLEGPSEELLAAAYEKVSA